MIYTSIFLLCPRIASFFVCIWHIHPPCWQWSCSTDKLLLTRFFCYPPHRRVFFMCNLTYRQSIYYHASIIHRFGWSDLHISVTQWNCRQSASADNARPGVNNYISFPFTTLASSGACRCRQNHSDRLALQCCQTIPLHWWMPWPLFSVARVYETVEQVAIEVTSATSRRLFYLFMGFLTRKNTDTQPEKKCQSVSVSTWPAGNMVGLGKASIINKVNLIDKYDHFRNSKA